MTRLPHLPLAHLAALAVCGGLVAIHQPREAIAAFVSHLSLRLAAGRRVALVVCVAVGVGLSAASPTGGLVPTHISKEPVHDRAPQPPHVRPSA